MTKEPATPEKLQREFDRFVAAVRACSEIWERELAAPLSKMVTIRKDARRTNAKRP